MPRQATLDMYVVYENPSDFPGCFVVRKWTGETPNRHPHSVTANIEEARTTIPAGLYRTPRHEKDDPVIREVWL